MAHAVTAEGLQKLLHEELHRAIEEVLRPEISAAVRRLETAVRSQAVGIGGNPDDQQAPSDGNGKQVPLLQPLSRQASESRSLSVVDENGSLSSSTVRFRLGEAKGAETRMRFRAVRKSLFKEEAAEGLQEELRGYPDEKADRRSRSKESSKHASTRTLSRLEMYESEKSSGPKVDKSAVEQKVDRDGAMLSPGHKERGRYKLSKKTSNESSYKSLSRDEFFDDDEDTPHLARCVNSVGYGIFVTFLIIVNAIAMGVESDYALKNYTEPRPDVFNRLNGAFSLLFAGDIMMQMLANGRKFCTMFNFMDSTVVSLQLTEVFLERQMASRAHPIPGPLLSALRMCRFLRVLRILRLGHVFEFIELRMLVMTLGGSLRSLGWTIMLILLATYTFSLYLTDVIADHWYQNPDLAAEEEEIRDFCGSFLGTMLTLYEAVSDGVEWKHLMDPIKNNVSSFLAIPFCLYISFMVFAFLNVITGVFLNAAVLTAEDDKKRVMGMNIKKMFEQADLDGSGEVSWEELSTQLHSKQMRMYLKAIDIKPEQAQQLFYLLDEDNSGEVSISEFVGGCLKLHGGVKAIDFAAFAEDQRNWGIMVEAMIQELNAAIFDIHARVFPHLGLPQSMSQARERTDRGPSVPPLADSRPER